MDIHQGKALSSIIHESGYSITTLAKKLGTSRSTLYSRLKTPKLPVGFLLLVGKVLKYDLRKVFPGIKDTYVSPESLQIIKGNYIRLLEKHYSILIITFKFLIENDNRAVKEVVEEHLYDILIKKNTFDPLSILKLLEEDKLD